MGNARDADDDDLLSAHDRVINRIFGSGLTLASILNLPRVDHEVCERVRDVIDQLDHAVAELRHAALAATVSRGDARPETDETVRDVFHELDKNKPLSYQDGHAR